MYRATVGFDQEPASIPPGFDPSAAGPLNRPTALGLLTAADDYLDASEPDRALALYARVIGMPDRDVSAAAFFGMGNALYRLDRDDEALRAWEQSVQLGETPVTYRAWRQIAAARVRNGDLRSAIDAYRECERRAPREDRPEIASRLGWLSKETGNQSAAGRYFAKSRGDAGTPFVALLIIAATVIVSIAAENGQAGSSLTNSLELNKVFVAHGEYYRLLSVTLVHAGLLHLFFNMYALWLVGPIVERMYGSVLMAFFYVACGIAASVASMVFGDAIYAVGASGAIFGLFGVVFASLRAHNPVLDRQSRAVAGQLGFLIVINLIFGFSIPGIDNTAHIGGLVAGLWLGFLIPPGQVPTLSQFWQSQRGGTPQPVLLAGRLAGVVALAAIVGFGVVYSTPTWLDREKQLPPQLRYDQTSVVPVVAPSPPAEPYALVEIGR